MKMTKSSMYQWILLLSLSIFTFSSCDKIFKEEEDVTPEEDTEAPSISIQSPTTDATFSTTDDRLSFSGTASDNEGLKSVQWSINSNLKTDATGKESWTVDFVDLLEGENIFVAYAEDESGNSSSDTLKITKNKTLVFIGEPMLNPDAVFENTPTNVIVSVQFAPNTDLVASSVQLIEVDDNGEEEDVLMNLYDDGDLINGDEILGDNIYSGIYNFNVSDDVDLKIKAQTDDGQEVVTGYSAVFTLTVYEPVEAGDMEEILDTHDQAYSKLNEFLDQYDFETAVEELVDWLTDLPHVANAYSVDGDIMIEYTNGLISGIMISEYDDADGNMTLGGMSTHQDPVRKVKVPLAEQTRGSNQFPAHYRTAAKQNVDENIIPDKDVFIYEPFASFIPAAYQSGDKIKKAFEDADKEYNIVQLKNQSCTIEALQGITEYGFVFFETHGISATWVMTGQIVDPDDDYDLLLKSKKIAVFMNLQYDKDSVNKKDDFYGVSDKFFSSLSGKFPNSVILNNSCEGMKSNTLANVFKGKGAKTYLGYDNNVWASFASSSAISFVQELVKDQTTTGEAFNKVSPKQDPKSPNANFKMDGSDKMYYTNTLINGDFECGDLTAWFKDGDGRVITQLSTQSPTQKSFMGIISTGLGYSTSSGQISQSFKVGNEQKKLSLKWNFLSEEFLEYVGSQYQDFMKISLIVEGSETVLFNKAIDAFNSEYALTPVSPQISFDQGDVYMTGWQTMELDVSAYAGKNVTLVITVGDVGDSIYDSAVLLDEITIE